MKLFRTIGLSRVEVQDAVCGDIVTISGIPSIYVGDTVGVGLFDPLPPIHIDEPTLTMDFLVNDSPFAGREGKLVTSRNLQERLAKELEMNVGLRVDFTEKTRFTVSGRGELHLSVLIETMRREGYELQVSAPQVIWKFVDGVKMEPVEHLSMIVNESLSGTMIQELSNRKGVMLTMDTDEHGQTTIEFEVPTRGLL
jgi:GTP-binding protein